MIDVFTGCPIRTHVTESYHPAPEQRATSVYGVQGVSGRGISSVPVSQQAYFIIDMHGTNWKLSDIQVDVRGFPSPLTSSSSVHRSPSTRSYNNMSTVPPSNNNNQLGVPLVHHGGRGSGRSGSGASGGAGGYETDDSVFARGSLLPAGAYEDHGGGV